MALASAKKRFVVVVCGCVVGFLLLGALFAYFGPARQVIFYTFRKLHLKPRKAEDAITPVAKDLDRHAEFLERSKQGNIDILFLGDSITNRWQTVGATSWQRLTPFKPANFGIDGECTEDLLWRLEHGELDAISPKVVILLIGSNNVFYFADESPEWTARGVEKIVRLIQGRLPASKVLLFAIFPREEKGSRVRKTIAAVNREIQRLDDQAHVHFIDIGSQFLDGDDNIPPDIMPDKVHLSAKGYALWYRSLESILPEMLK